MKKLLILALGMVFLLGSSGLLSAQPEATGYTLSDIYYYLTEGIEATEGGHSLEPPALAAPGQAVEGFDKSLVDIYYFMADVFGQADLTKTDLAGKGLSGKKYFSTDPEHWGVLELFPSPTPAPTPDWYLTYGPDGTGDVVRIYDMYVSADLAGPGTAAGGVYEWQAAMDWSEGLHWLGVQDWCLPTANDGNRICANRASLTGTFNGQYWSAEANGGQCACYQYAFNGSPQKKCSTYTQAGCNQWYKVIAVRYAP